MANPRLTPEEQLLKLIEKGDDAEAAKFKRKRKLFLDFSNFKIFWFSLGKKFSQAVASLRSGLREPNLKVLNKVLLGASITLLVYSITLFVFNRPRLEEVYQKGRTARGTTAQLQPQEVRPFLHYLEMVRRRNVFSPIEVKEAEEVDIGDRQLQEMAKDLSLVGISWDNHQPLAMIEDKVAQKTYFLKKGDMINRFTIKDILNNKVILSFEDRTIELM